MQVALIGVNFFHFFIHHSNFLSILYIKSKNMKILCSIKIYFKRFNYLKLFYFFLSLFLTCEKQINEMSEVMTKCVCISAASFCCLCGNYLIQRERERETVTVMGVTKNFFSDPMQIAVIYKMKTNGWRNYYIFIMRFYITKAEILLQLLFCMPFCGCFHM